MHAAFGAGIMACDVVGDGRWGGLRRLLEGDGTRNLGVSTDDGNYDMDTFGQSGIRSQMSCMDEKAKSTEVWRGLDVSGGGTVQWSHPDWTDERYECDALWIFFFRIVSASKTNLLNTARLAHEATNWRGRALRSNLR